MECGVLGSMAVYCIEDSCEFILALVPLDFDAKRSFELDEAVEIVKEALKPLGKEYGDTIDELLDGHIICSNSVYIVCLKTDVK